ncbi:MAG: hypothetical protein ACR2HF_09065 [Methylococcaceae bacterium]
MIGRLGKYVLVASTNTTVYTAPTAALYSIVDINLLNNTGSAATVKIAISTSGTPAAGDYIEDGVAIAASGGVFLREKVYLSPGEYLIVYATQAVTVRIAGQEYTN